MSDPQIQPPSNLAASCNGGIADVAVATTAALPWRTGPAFFSLWHAGGLAALGLNVVYTAPWLSPASQARLGQNPRFESPEKQAQWLAEEARRLGAPALPRITFYPAWYSSVLRSIVPLRDVFAHIPPARNLVLQEPEHLCWHPFTRPRAQAQAERIIGIVMTNYGFYLRKSGLIGRMLAPLVERRHLSLMARHADSIVCLAPEVLGDTWFPVSDARVTGVVRAFHETPPVTAETQGAYFIGRLVWDKGAADLIEVAARMNLPIDVIGAGPDETAIRDLARRRGAPISFLGPTPAPWEKIVGKRVFFNPSASEMLCTSTAEALVAGRHVVMPDCPGNRPFLRHPNVHLYTDLDGAVAALERAAAVLPEHPALARREFDWMTACRTLADLLV